jgi:hypothetical protein
MRCDVMRYKKYTTISILYKSQAVNIHVRLCACGIAVQEGFYLNDLGEIYN